MFPLPSELIETEEAQGPPSAVETSDSAFAITIAGWPGVKPAPVNEKFLDVDASPYIDEKLVIDPVAGVIVCANPAKASKEKTADNKKLRKILNLISISLHDKKREVRVQVLHYITLISATVCSANTTYRVKLI